MFYDVFVPRVVSLLQKIGEDGALTEDLCQGLTR